MSLIFSTDKLSNPGVYSYTVPSGVGEIEVHLWGAGGADGSRGRDQTVVLNPGRAGQSTAAGSRTFTSSGEFTVPPLVTSINVTVVGGGGGGGRYHSGCSNKTTHPGGSGGGGFVSAGTLEVTPGERISFTVGAGGAAGNSGSAGGTSSFRGISAAGGGGGSGNAAKVGTNGTDGGGGNGGAGGTNRDTDPNGRNGGSGSVTVSWSGIDIPAIQRVTTEVPGGSGGKGAAGGYAYSKVKVLPGDVVTIAVGARGSASSGGASVDSPISYRGGSATLGSISDGGGGGGATVVLVNDVVVAVAGGGGGGGSGGQGGYRLTPSSSSVSVSGQQQFTNLGLDSITVPEGVTSMFVELYGAGGGGGGSDSQAGYDGSAGGYVSGNISVTPGDVIIVGVGQGGRPGLDNGQRYGGGEGGTGLNGEYAGGTGGNPGPGGYSGAGGGGGGASVVLVNTTLVAAAAGGGGGGGGGNNSAAQAAIQSTVGGTSGSPGASENSDGGGGGGGGGGASGGAGGAIRPGDNGAYSGSNGTNLVPAGGSTGIGANGGQGAIRGNRLAGAGTNGNVRISWTQTITTPGTDVITYDPTSNSIGGDGLPATNNGTGYGVRGVGESAIGGSSSGGGGGGGFYGGAAGVSGSIGGGGRGGTNFGNVTISGTNETVGGLTIAEYPGGRVGYARYDGAVVINFIRSFTMYVKKSSNWKLIDQAWVKVSGVWKPIYNGWVKVNGQWELITADPTVNTPEQTYTITSNISSVNEGSAVRFILSTTGVTPGTIIPYTAFGVTSGDLAAGSLTGRFTVGTTDFIEFVPRSDRTTTGNRSITVELNNLDKRHTVTIADTSLGPSGTLTSNVASVNEGSAVRFTLSTSNADAGTVIPYAITGITADDLSVGSITGNFIVGSEEYKDFVLASDFTDRELNESMTMSTFGVVRKSATVTVFDTSIMPAGEVVFPLGETPFSVPLGVTKIKISAYGGGGSGGSGDGGKNNEGPGYGGGGSNLIKELRTVTPGQLLNVTVGAGGVGGFGLGGRAGGPSTVTGTGMTTFIAAGGGGGGGHPGWAGPGELSPGVYDTSNRPGAGANGAGSGSGSTGGKSTNGGSNGGNGGPYNMQGGSPGTDGYLKIEWGPTVK